MLCGKCQTETNSYHAYIAPVGSPGEERQLEPPRAPSAMGTCRYQSSRIRATNYGFPLAARLDPVASVGGLGASHVSREWQDSNSGQ